MGSLQASAPMLVVEYPFGVSWVEHLDSLASSLFIELGRNSFPPALL